MKKFLITLFIALTAIAGHAANDLIVDGVVYSWSPDNTAYVVTGCDENEPRETLHILSEVDGLDVVAIGNNAFIDNTTITSVIIDEGITRIGANAFDRCANLRHMVLPEGLTTIEEEAFAFCTSLTMMVIPSTVTDIQAHAFSGCTGVTDAYFLMTTPTQLSDFDWWDGVYTHPGEEERGGLEFNHSRLRDLDNGTRIHVPEGTLSTYEDSGKFEAWLLQADDGAFPLWWIVNYGVVGRAYTVSDNLAGVFVDKNGVLYAKDYGKYLFPVAAAEDQVDYVIGAHLQPRDWDQSNWVQLSFGDAIAAQQFVDKVITGGTLTGTLNDKLNPAMTVTGHEPPGTPEHYDANNYVVCNFMKPNVQTGNNGHQYFFMTPKPQEYCKVNWATYEGDDRFTLNPDSGNRYDLTGSFTVSWELYPGNRETDFVEGKTYSFHAIMRHKATASDLSRRNRASASVTEGPYTVFPLEGGAGVITAVENISTDHEVQSVKYVNPTGMTSATPFSGVNIVVTRYHNGTTHVSKMTNCH